MSRKSYFWLRIVASRMLRWLLDSLAVDEDLATVVE